MAIPRLREISATAVNPGDAHAVPDIPAQFREVFGGNTDGDIQQQHFGRSVPLPDFARGVLGGLRQFRSIGETRRLMDAMIRPAFRG